IIEEYVKNEADIAKLKTGSQYPILFERIKTTILELETRNAKLKPIIEEFTKKSESSHLVTGKKNRKFQTKCIQIAEEIPNEEPIIEYRPPFLNGLEFDAFFQKYRIALEVQGSQHRFHNTGWYKDVKKFEDIVNRDRLKRCMCQDNRIFLLEVWYNEKPKIVIPQRIQKIKSFVNQASKIFDL
ncbi:2036_t:CDS:1, partial [Diversispora eburnea]